MCLATAVRTQSPSTLLPCPIRYTHSACHHLQYAVQGIKPEVRTYNTIITACNKSGKPEQGLKVRCAHVSLTHRWMRYCHGCQQHATLCTRCDPVTPPPHTHKATLVPRLLTHCSALSRCINACWLQACGPLPLLTPLSLAHMASRARSRQQWRCLQVINAPLNLLAIEGRRQHCIIDCHVLLLLRLSSCHANFFG